MSLHISRFLDRIRAAESRHQREITMSLTEARDLHTDITRLLMQLNESKTASNQESPSVTRIEIQGGAF
jgi:hypothetical protein